MNTMVEKIKNHKILYKILFNINIILKECYYSIFRIIFLILCVVFKINEKKIICSSYNHTRISCNPKYITKYLIENNIHDFEIVWVLRKSKQNDQNIEGVRFVKFLSLRYLYEMATAKYILSNQRTDFIVGKRKNQKYIQLWHSSVRLKKIEGDAEKYLSKYYIKMAKKDSKKTDVMVSGSKHSTEIYRRAFWFSGEILEIGTPRNDILFNNNDMLVNNIREKIGIPKDNKVLLYAPTFRNNYQYDYNLLEVKKLKNILEKNSNENWIILIKFHPNMIRENIYDNILDSAINVSNYEDIQELFLISDYLITDYSSVMFDFCLTYKPIFLFVPDLEKYYLMERDLYFQLEELPFSISKNMKELERNITSFELDIYKNSVKKFLGKIGSFESGNACEKFIDYLKQ